MAFLSTYWQLFTLIAALLLFKRAVVLRAGSRWLALAGELALVWAMALSYFVVRGMKLDNGDLAQDHADHVIGFERRLHIFHEPWLQHQVLRHDWIMRLANCVYVWWHWPLIVAVLVWLYIKRPDDYPVYRNAFLISGALGLIIFAAFPVAPPRFMHEFGVADTVNKRAIFNNILLPPSLTNVYAAMPSLHAGWNLLIGIALFKHATRPSVRAFGLLMPLAMYAAIVLTGNHYIVDGLAGDTIAELSLLVALAFRTHATTAERAPAPALAVEQPRGRDRHPAMS
jgi:hypothetical protein